MDQYKKLVKGKQCEMQRLLATTCAVGRVILWVSSPGLPPLEAPVMIVEKCKLFFSFLCVYISAPSKHFTIWDADCRYALCWQDLIHMPLQSLAQHITGSNVKSKVCHTQVGFVSRLSALLLADTTKLLSVFLQYKQVMCVLGRPVQGLHSYLKYLRSSFCACKLSDICNFVQTTCRDII